MIKKTPHIQNNQGTRNVWQRCCDFYQLENPTVLIYLLEKNRLKIASENI